MQFSIARSIMATYFPACTQMANNQMATHMAHKPGGVSLAQCLAQCLCRSVPQKIVKLPELPKQCSAPAHVRWVSLDQTSIGPLQYLWRNAGLHPRQFASFVSVIKFSYACPSQDRPDT
jgi:hypothetical protein